MFGLVAAVGVFTLYLFFRLMAWVVRGVIGESTTSTPPIPARACANSGCRVTNPSWARYCGRCGRPLLDSRDVDTYG